MCVIVVKPAGTKVPDKELLAQCWQANPHGAGYMFARSGRVHIRKGFMTLRGFQQSISTVLSQEDVAVLHFRLATSGLIGKGQTHPFPLSHSRRSLCATRLTCAVGVAHNGVVGDGEGILSDTQVFVRDVLSHPFLLSHWGEEDCMDFLPSLLKGSKWAFLSGEGTVHLAGQFETYKEYMVSNQFFLSSTTRTGHRNWSIYDLWGSSFYEEEGEEEEETNV